MAKKERGRPKGTPLESGLRIKGTRSWRQWLEDWANRRKVSSTKLIDEALEEKAERDGQPPPPNRTGDE